VDASEARSPHDASFDSPDRDGGISYTYGLAGHLAVARTLFADTDTADLTRSRASNDSEDAAQRITVPAVVGGYLGPIAGKPGGDNTDYYLVDLAAADTVTLRIADPGPGKPLPDFDLRLLDNGFSEGFSGFIS
jgi:hypothetical protein